MSDLHDIQIEMEIEAQEIKRRKEYLNLIKASEQGRYDETKPGTSLMKIYFPVLRDKVQEYLTTEYKGHTGKTQRYIKYLCDDTDKITYVILQSLIKKLAQRANKVKVVTMAGYIVQNLRVLQTFANAEETNPKLIAYLGSEYRRASARRKKDLMEKHLKEFEQHHITKVKSEDIKAGSTLIDLVIHCNMELIEKKKLFQRGIDRYSTLYLMFTPEVFNIISKVNYIPPTLALFPPMIVPPKPWDGFASGGYLTVKNKFIKLKGKEALLELRDKDYSKPMIAINKLQATAWRNNSKLIEVVQYIYKHNIVDPRSPPTLPRLYGDIPTSIPTKVEDLIDGFGNYPENPTQEEKKVWAIWNRKREKLKIGLDGENGRRLQYLMTMGVVEKMKEFERFYYVYQLDYRGRVYPITDFYNPQSKGYVKAMLEFADGHYLDDKGVYWLKVHSANTFGMDKEPFSERIQWAEDNRQSMLEAAEDPLGSLGYWAMADSPFEFLAACMALSEHVKGNVVHLPIQLDAINSGVQMYSGLLRDKIGATSTAVIPAYSIVEVEDNYTLKEGEHWYDEDV